MLMTIAIRKQLSREHHSRQVHVESTTYWGWASPRIKQELGNRVTLEQEYVSIWLVALRLEGAVCQCQLGVSFGMAGEFEHLKRRRNDVILALSSHGVPDTQRDNCVRHLRVVAIARSPRLLELDPLANGVEAGALTRIQLSVRVGLRVRVAILLEGYTSPSSSSIVSSSSSSTQSSAQSHVKHTIGVSRAI